MAVFGDINKRYFDFSCRSYHKTPEGHHSTNDMGNQTSDDNQAYNKTGNKSVNNTNKTDSKTRSNTIMKIVFRHGHQRTQLNQASPHNQPSPHNQLLTFHVEIKMQR